MEEREFWKELMKKLRDASFIWYRAFEKARFPHTKSIDGQKVWGVKFNNRSVLPLRKNFYTLRDLPQILLRYRSPVAEPWEMGPLVFPLLAYRYQNGRWFALGGPDPFRDQDIPLREVRVAPHKMVWHGPSFSVLLDVDSFFTVSTINHGEILDFSSLPVEQKGFLFAGIDALIKVLQEAANSRKSLPILPPMPKGIRNGEGESLWWKTVLKELL